MWRERKNTEIKSKFYCSCMKMWKIYRRWIASIALAVSICTVEHNRTIAQKWNSWSINLLIPRKIFSVPNCVKSCRLWCACPDPLGEQSTIKTGKSFWLANQSSFAISCARQFRYRALIVFHRAKRTKQLQIFRQTNFVSIPSCPAMRKHHSRYRFNHLHKFIWNDFSNTFSSLWWNRYDSAKQFTIFAS